LTAYKIAAKKKERIAIKKFRYLTNIIYSIAGGSLLFTAIALVTRGLWDIVRAFGQPPVGTHLLRAVGLIVVAMAIFDVAKYLFEEEVVGNRELGHTDEARKSLTKFMVIIIIALSLQGLTFIFITGQTTVQLLLYPAGLIVTAGLLMLGVGYYQKLSVHTELDSTSANTDNPTNDER
jgi:hypothetical protein